MNYIYEIKGAYNTNPIKVKRFKNYEKAVKYLDSLVNAYDLQIEEVLSSNNELTYVANDYSRFTISTILA